MNPFEFKNHNLQNITFNVRGELYPRVPYDLNFQENDFHRALWITCMQLQLADQIIVQT